jgi:hypothetical protein
MRAAAKRTTSPDRTGRKAYQDFQAGNRGFRSFLHLAGKLPRPRIDLLSAPAIIEQEKTNNDVSATKYLYLPFIGDWRLKQDNHSQLERISLSPPF